ncbi:hypothetical protein T492DRAFT_1144008 [Pavlovales sp. CCMP2436]|nr:hypothetical protein T492DRAFT_1144008 [Pavlovales sp. CCMP2436]
MGSARLAGAAIAVGAAAGVIVLLVRRRRRAWRRYPLSPMDGVEHELPSAAPGRWSSSGAQCRWSTASRPRPSFTRSSSRSSPSCAPSSARPRHSCAS